MKPYYEKDGQTIYHGDCRDVLPMIASRVSSIVSDPPYGMDNDTDYSRFSAGPHGEASSRTYERIKGDDQPFDPSPFLEFQRVILWGSNHFSARLPVGTTLVWIKRFDEGFGSFLSDAEIGWMRGGHGVYCRRDTSLLAETRCRRHPNQKPIGLMQWCIEKLGPMTETDVIADPFAGSGSTLVAAKRLGVTAIGIEFEERYCEAAAKRLDNTTKPLFV